MAKRRDMGAKKRLPKRLRLFNESHVSGHDVILTVDPFVARSLTEVLKVYRYKFNPVLGRLNMLFSGFDSFSYRLHSRQIWGRNPTNMNCFEAYHEGLHVLLAHRYGSRTKGRPMMTLLNECMAQPFDLYFMAVLSNYYPSLDVTQIDPTGAFIAVTGRRLEVDTMKHFEEAKKNPFAAYRRTMHEIYNHYKAVLDFLLSPSADIREGMNKLTKVVKKSELVDFYAHGSTANQPLFIAEHCGQKSTLEDKRAVKDCLKILDSSKSMEEMLKRFGIEELIEQGKRRSG